MHSEFTKTRAVVSEIRDALVGSLKETDKPSIISRIKTLEESEKARIWWIRTIAGTTVAVAVAQVWQWLKGER